jgi:SAM-dependent methyltransferase
VPDRPPLGAILARGPRYILRVGLLLGVLQISERAIALIEAVLGVDTGGFVSAGELELSPLGHGFAPSPWSTLRRVLPPHEVSPGDAFCDVGAGKGRILLAAAIGYRFARVLGIEASPKLVAIARQNVDALRLPVRSGTIAVEQGDMTDFSLPDDITIVYAYDPFEGDLFDALTRDLIASVQRRPRALRFIYLAPYQEHQLLQTGRIRLIRRVRWGVRRLDPRWQGVALYEVF